MEVHLVDSWRRYTVYLVVSDWWERLEQYRHLIAPSPPDFDYYSDYGMRVDRSCDVFMSIDVCELLMTTVLSYVAAESSDVLFNSTADGRIINHEAVLVPVPVGFLEKLDSNMFYRPSMRRVLAVCVTCWILSKGSRSTGC